MNNNKVIVVFGGGVNRDEAGQWHSTNFGERAEVGETGSYVRVVATAILAKRDPEAVVVASGGRGQAGHLLPVGLTLATIMKDELVKLDLSADSIIEESQSNNTFEQLREIAGLAVDHDWQSVKLVSSRYHLPRIQAMMEHFSPLASLRSIVSLASAEEVVLAEDAKSWQLVIAEAYASPEFAAIIEKEKQGVEQIKKGTYHYE